jgi:alpha-beta hydrolase superfamily lysophospholipase
MGGSLATGLACHRRACHDALLLCAPGLAQIRARLSPEAAAARRRQDSAELLPLPLEDRWYTTDPRYLEHMAADTVMVRQTTARFGAAALLLEDWYMGLSEPLAAKPSALLTPRSDRIIDLAVARKAFEYLTAGGGMQLELPTESHYLEFSSERDRYWQFLAAFSLARGFGARE